MLTHEALLTLGVDSKILFLVDPGGDGKARWSYHHLSPWHRARRLAVTLLERLPVQVYRRRNPGLFSSGWIGLGLDRLALFRWADVIHLHWVNHGLVDIADLARWRKPLVWTMRDMWPFTGGCHYSLGCDGYTRQCGRCPLLGSAQDDDLSARVLLRKRRHLAGLNIRWVAISRWLREEAERSQVLRSRPIDVVPSGIRTSEFRRMESAAARSALGLPRDGELVLLGANNLRDRNKGLAFAREALCGLRRTLTVVTFGHGAIEKSDVPHPVINLGYVAGATKLSAVYSAADVFLSPSVGEAFGKTFAEAQVCGLPVVCFDDTGPADIVEHRRTGYLARHGDKSDLTTGLEFALAEKLDRHYISERARARFDISEVARRYRDLYENIKND